MFRIVAETLDNVTYLFRGESNNRYQSNYSNKNKTRFKSRFYAYELFSGMQLFGNIAAYELLPSARILDYGDSVSQFIEDYQLEEYRVPELEKIYNISCLNELFEYGGNVECDYHDLYHSQQLVAIAYLEDKMSSQYDGICWYESNDTPQDQVMIWNDKCVRRLSYAEVEELLHRLEDIHTDLGIEDSLYRKGYDGKYNYRISRKQ